LVLCRPIEDALAALELHKRGELKMAEWIAQLLRTNKFPFFEIKDPMPAAFTLSRRAWQAAGLMLSAATRVGRRSEAGA
jgi:predicted ATP-grasp superfamily ATP-dependent carboligase